MKALPQSGVGAALCALLVLAASAAAAPAPPVTLPIKFGPAPSQVRPQPQPQPSLFIPFYGYPYSDHDVVTHVIEREVVREVPVVAPALPPPREPYVIGHSYDSLPGGCLKLVEGSARYFMCSGEWYREVGRSQYKAVESPL
jgi:hypothetical protein